MGVGGSATKNGGWTCLWDGLWRWFGSLRVYQPSGFHKQGKIESEASSGSAVW